MSEKLLQQTLEMLADQVVWHLNQNRPGAAQHIIDEMESMDVELPYSKLTCSNLKPIMEHHNSMKKRREHG